MQMEDLGMNKILLTKILNFLAKVHPLFVYVLRKTTLSLLHRLDKTFFRPPGSMVSTIFVGKFYAGVKKLGRFDSFKKKFVSKTT